MLITDASNTVAASPGSPHSAIIGSQTRPTISSNPVTFSAWMITKAITTFGSRLVVAMVKPRRAPSIKRSIRFLRTSAVIFSLLDLTGFHVRNPCSEKIGTYKFKDQNHCQRGDNRHGDAGEQRRAGREVMGDNCATAGLKGGENRSFPVADNAFIGELFGHTCSRIGVLQIGDKRQ